MLNLRLDTCGIICLILLATGCGEPSPNADLTMGDVPDYPGAEADAVISQSIGGIGGAIRQLTSEDDFETVREFYRQALAPFETEEISNTSPLGRQVAITMPRDDGLITVSIQEFRSEATVNITIMQAGGS